MDIKYIEYRSKWMSEKSIYEDLGVEIKELITQLLKTNGIQAKITYRLKDNDSLIKKIARKSSTYNSIHDKVGVRIIAYFKKQMETIDNLLVENLNYLIKKRENMIDNQKENEFGYQSIHYDFCKIVDGMECFCEVQLRTICQDNWSELSHELAYKTEIDLPKNIIREMNALSALFELADNQFQLIQNLISDLPDTNPVKILNYLEKFFYTYLGSHYDKELSLYFLKHIENLYENTNPLLTLDEFINSYRENIEKIVQEYSNNLFFTQPEIIIILEQLQNKKYKFISYWNTLYPIEELEEIANAWGTSIY